MLVLHLAGKRRQVEQQGAGDVVRQVADNAQLLSCGYRDRTEVELQGVAGVDGQPLARKILFQAGDQVAVQLHHVHVLERAQQTLGHRGQAGADLDHRVAIDRADGGRDVVEDGVSTGSIGHADGSADRRVHAAAVGQAEPLAGQVERGAVVDRGADQGQAQGDVDAVAERGEFQHRQALVVVHGQHAVGVHQVLGLEQGVGRIRTGNIDAARARRVQRRRDGVDFLAAQVAALARMRVQAAHQDARRCQAELGLEVAVDDVDDAPQPVLAQGGRHVFQRQMGGGQRHPQRPPFRIDVGRQRAGQHHDDLVGTGALGKILGVAGKRHAGIVDGAFLQRRRDHGLEPAGLHAFDGGVQRGQHGAAVFRIELARHHVGVKRDVDHAEALGTEVRQAAVAHRHQRQRRHADRRVDGGRRHGQKRGIAQQHAVDVVPARPGGAQRNLGADAGRLADRDGNGRPAAPGGGGWGTGAAGVRSMRGVRMCAHGCSRWGYCGCGAIEPSSLRNSTNARSRTSRCQLSHFDQVHAEARFHRIADFADLEGVHGRFEFRHQVARVQPAQVAALAGRAVGGEQARQFLEGGALVGQALLEFGQLALGVGRAHGGRDLDQDVARVGLLHGVHGLRIGHAAAVDSLQDVERAHALDDRRHLARRELGQRFGKHGRQPLGLAPADGAALQRIAGVGIRGGGLGEVGAGAQLAHHFLGARAALGNHLGRGVVGNAYHDLRDVDFVLLGGGGFLGGQVAVHLGVGNLDLGVHLVFAQALHDDFFADFFAEGSVGRALFFHLVAQVLHRGFLRFGDAGNGAVELDVIDAHAHFLGQLQLGALDDHAFEQLALQVGSGRHLHVLRLHARRDGLDAVVELTARDDVVVDHHHDRIDGHIARRARRHEARTVGLGHRFGGRLGHGRGSSGRRRYGRRWCGFFREQAATAQGGAAQQDGEDFHLVRITHGGTLMSQAVELELEEDRRGCLGGRGHEALRAHAEHPAIVAVLEADQAFQDFLVLGRIADAAHAVPALEQRPLARQFDILEVARIVLHRAVEGPGIRNAAAGGQQNVGVGVDHGRRREQLHALVFEIKTLAERQAQLFGARAVEEARDQCGRELVGVADPVRTDKAVFAENLAEVERGRIGIERGELALVAVRRAHVEQARLQRLRHVLAQEPGVAFEHQPGIDRERGNRARQVAGAAAGLVVELVAGRVEHQLGRNKIARCDDRIAELRNAHDAGAVGQRRMVEARQFAVEGPVEAAQHIVLRRMEIDRGQAVVGTRHEQRLVDVRFRVLQHLVLLHARGQGPEIAVVVGAQFAQQLPLGRARHCLGEIVGIVVIRRSAHIPAVRPVFRQLLVVHRLDGPAAAFGLAHVAPLGAHLHAAAQNDFRVQRQVAVGRDIDVVRHQQLGLALGAEARRGRQPARTARTRQRERQCGRAQDRHVLEIDNGLAGRADVAPGIEVERARAQIPVRVRALAGTVGAVDDLGFVLADEVDALGLALRLVRFHLVGRVEHIALAAIHVELELVAGEEVAVAPDLHAAVGFHLVFHLAETSRVGLHLGLVLDDFGIALERDFTLGATADLLGLDDGGRIGIDHPRRALLGRNGRQYRRGGMDRSLGVRGHCRYGNEGSEGVCPANLTSLADHADPRLAQLGAWIATLNVVDVASARPASSDASFRRYFRLDVLPEHQASLGATLIAMDAPPERENVLGFVKLDEMLTHAGVTVPRIVATDYERGFMLMSDLGTTTYLQVLDHDNASTMYAEALEALVKFQLTSEPDVLPEYDRAFLQRELNIFTECVCAPRLPFAQPDAARRRQSGRAGLPGCAVRPHHVRHRLAAARRVRAVGRGTGAGLGHPLLAARQVAGPAGQQGHRQFLPGFRIHGPAAPSENPRHLLPPPLPRRQGPVPGRPAHRDGLRAQDGRPLQGLEAAGAPAGPAGRRAAASPRPSADRLAHPEPGTRRHHGHRDQPRPPGRPDRADPGRRQQVRRETVLLARRDGAGNGRRHRQRPPPAGRCTVRGDLGRHLLPAVRLRAGQGRVARQGHVGQSVPGGPARHLLAVPGAQSPLPPGRRFRPDYVHAHQRRPAQMDLRLAARCTRANGTTWARCSSSSCSTPRAPRWRPAPPARSCSECDGCRHRACHATGAPAGATAARRGGRAGHRARSAAQRRQRLPVPLRQPFLLSDRFYRTGQRAGAGRRAGRCAGAQPPVLPRKKPGPRNLGGLAPRSRGRAHRLWRRRRPCHRQPGRCAHRTAGRRAGPVLRAGPQQRARRANPPLDGRRPRQGPRRRTRTSQCGRSAAAARRDAPAQGRQRAGHPAARGHHLGRCPRARHAPGAGRHARIRNRGGAAVRVSPPGRPGASLSAHRGGRRQRLRAALRRQQRARARRRPGADRRRLRARWLRIRHHPHLARQRPLHAAPAPARGRRDCRPAPPAVLHARHRPLAGTGRARRGALPRRARARQAVARAAAGHGADGGTGHLCAPGARLCGRYRRADAMTTTAPATVTLHYDVAICGAGPAGMALAALLVKRGVPAARIALIDAKTLAQAGADPRSLALSWGSRQILEDIGAWPIDSTAINEIHVSRRGQFGRSMITSKEQNVPALGYVTRYGAIVRALGGVVAAAGVAMQRPVRVEALDERADAVALTVTDLATGDVRTLHAAIVVQAEGGLFDEQQTRTRRRDYGQTAIIAQVRSDRPIAGRAYERFTEEGPLALLPQGDGPAGAHAAMHAENAAEWECGRILDGVVRAARARRAAAGAGRRSVPGAAGRGLRRTRGTFYARLAAPGFSAGAERRHGRYWRYGTLAPHGCHRQRGANAAPGGGTGTEPGTARRDRAGAPAGARRHAGQAGAIYRRAPPGPHDHRAPDRHHGAHLRQQLAGASLARAVAGGDRRGGAGAQRAGGIDDVRPAMTQSDRGGGPSRLRGNGNSSAGNIV
uniref:2-octaprenyl-6-methoxyphenol hydroxylase, putative n=1 Tax=Tanacetum cinerariifolium TaxID=118510 RepID=A0A699GDV7_TANCI|nr:2-octaprenyl-6-methoxyphenol hydroxylase, putative [Tanacetum cinerariifolium]